LAQRLARGELAPESVAIDLIRGAAATSHGQMLVLDGFPRHPEQLQLARELFSPLVGLLLDVPEELASRRLSSRRRCPSCGWSGSLQHEPRQHCPVCGNPDVHARPEDDPSVLPRRLAEAQQRLEAMLNQWGGWPLLRIDSGDDAGRVLEQAERLIREHSAMGHD
jgi:adenylate kinase